MKKKGDNWFILASFAILLLAAVLWWREASAATFYLEDEKDLGNGYKICIYSEGVRITVPSYKLCPISIEG